MNQREAYYRGRDNGEDAAEYAELPWTAAQANATSRKMDEVLEETWESEQGARQYAGFAYFAYEMNQAQPDWRMEALWDKYEEGVAVGIRKGLRKKGYDA